MYKKLKRKVWIISTIILVIYIITLVMNPSSWISLLPIIIPTTILTVGIPSYNIVKHTKEQIEKAVEIPVIQSKENIEKISEKQTVLNKQNSKTENKKEIQDTIINDNQINEVLEALSEQDNKDKIKVKKKELKFKFH